jgi:hypothetical protein
LALILKPSPAICTTSRTGLRVNPNTAGTLGKPFPAQNGNLHGLAVFHHNHKRNQPAIGKIEEINFAIRFVERPMVRQRQVLQVRADRAEFTIGKREQNSVANRLSLRASAFALANHSEVSLEHADPSLRI